MPRAKRVNSIPEIVVEKKKLFYRVYITGKNGKIILNSEAYYSKANAKRAALDLQTDTGFVLKDKTV